MEAAARHGDGFQEPTASKHRRIDLASIAAKGGGGGEWHCLMGTIFCRGPVPPIGSVWD